MSIGGKCTEVKGIVTNVFEVLSLFGFERFRDPALDGHCC